MCGRISMKGGKCHLASCLSVVSTEVFLWWIDRLGSRPLGGRHASVVPALPDEYESHLNNIRGGRRDDEGDGEEDPSRQGTSLPCSVSVNPVVVLISTLMKMGMDITRSLMAVRTWHSPPPPHSIHIMVPHTPRRCKETNNSSSWIRTPRCRLRILLDRVRMDQHCLQGSQAS